MEDLNLISCELIALALNPSGGLSQKRKVRGHSLPSQTERVTAYITRRLRAEFGVAGQLDTPISPAAYHALLPAIWAFIDSPSSSPHQSEELIHATLDHALKVTSKSACKRLTLEFVGRLMLVRHFPSAMANHK
jgi:pre-rRNA-processing protein IPI1